ncbi:hypothetical protein EES44_30020 [Streptomyces sp. ADI96-15]|nr:hypothetical protein EES44_30020 [Streptomyces sp. ADI96-15]
MRGVVHRDPADPRSLGLAPGHQRVQRGLFAGHHDRCRPVDRGDRGPVPAGGAPLPHPCRRSRDREHAAPAGQLTDHLTAQGHHTRPVLQRQRAGHHGGGDLPLRSSHHGVRAHTQGLPHRCQRHHHRPQRRLHHIHPVQGRGPGRPAQHVRQRPVDERGQRPGARVDPGGEHGRGGIQLPSHAHPLRALPGKHQGHLARHRGRARDHTGARHTPLDLPQTGRQRPRTAPQHHGTVLGHRAGHQRPRDAAHVDAGTVPRPPRQPSRLLPQLLGRAATDHPRHCSRTVRVVRGIGHVHERSHFPWDTRRVQPDGVRSWAARTTAEPVRNPLPGRRTSGRPVPQPLACGSGVRGSAGPRPGCRGARALTGRSRRRRRCTAP